MRKSDGCKAIDLLRRMIVIRNSRRKHQSSNSEEVTTPFQAHLKNYMIKTDFQSMWPKILTRKSWISKPSKIWSAELQRNYLCIMKDPMARRCWVWRAWLWLFRLTRLPLKSWMTTSHWVLTFWPTITRKSTRISSQELTLWTAVPPRRNQGSLLEINKVKIHNSRPSLEI